MKNTCNYSDDWQPYIDDYDKFEYDIKLADGTIIENCYPNAGKFNSFSDEHDDQQFEESLVSEIRFSQRPRHGMNDGVSNVPQYEWLDKQMKERELQQLSTPDQNPQYIDFKKHEPYWYSVPKPKSSPVKSESVGRNELCSCGSGKKSKKCCL